MVVLGAILGAVVALAVVIVPAEWFLADEFSESVEIIITVLVAAVGGFLGAQLARRFAGRQRRELT